MMNVITISRQMGSLGRDVARLLADRLGFRLVWRDLINQAALRAGAPEMALAVIDELGLLGIRPSPLICQAYRQAVEQIMRELADEGNIVILGRAGQIILADRTDTFHVRVIAPLEIRISRIAAIENISLECARAQIETSDRYRTRYLRRFYHVRWDDPLLYHLVINSGKISPPVAVDMIANAIHVIH